MNKEFLFNTSGSQAVAALFGTFNMRFVCGMVVANNMIRLALNPPATWIRRRKINPTITTAVRTYAIKNWVDTARVVNYEGVKQILKKVDKCIIDVRDPDEVSSTGMIPSSVNIPASYIDSALVMTNADFQRVYKRRKPSKKHDLIFYCRSGQRALEASDKAFKLGYGKAKAYIGSWEDWETRSKIDIKRDARGKEKRNKTNEFDES